MYKFWVQNQLKEQEHLGQQIKNTFGFDIHISLNITRALKLQCIAHLTSDHFPLIRIIVI